MVLELARPADWEALSKVWRGVQVDLELPAPGIAVSGMDGYQLWFSLSEPLAVTQAMAFFESLRARYLSDIAPARIRVVPAADARMVPAQQDTADHWSAFVAPDLAAVFGETPWLDFPPNPEGQAELLSRLESIKHADFLRALARLKPAVIAPESTDTSLDPKRFLLGVMNNDAVALDLRIEAAKALLPYCAQ